MNFEIVEQARRFRLHGLSSAVDGCRYGEVGCRLMERMWQVLKDAAFKTTGINHWVYFADDRMFVGVEAEDGEQAAVPEPLETLAFELDRYSQYVHVGPYQLLPEVWQALKAELAAEGETVSMPSLEVYGHSCEGADESEAKTTIVLGLKPRGT